MQYILSQEELDELKKAQEIKIGLSTKKLQTLCSKICNEMPIDRHWDEDDKSPWGCLLTVQEMHHRSGDHVEWYCDDCPVQDICPYKWKEYSK